MSSKRASILGAADAFTRIVYGKSARDVVREMLRDGQRPEIRDPDDLTEEDVAGALDSLYGGNEEELRDYFVGEEEPAGILGEEPAGGPYTRGQFYNDYMAYKNERAEREARARGEERYTDDETMPLAAARHVLGVDANATADELRRRFWSLSKQYHPDALGSDATPEQRKAAVAKFMDASRAYDRLTEEMTKE